MGLLYNMLSKKGIRSDSVWTNASIYRSFLVRIPLFLDTYALLRSQYWPRATITKLQDERLREVIRYAACIPYWREVFEKAHLDPHVPVRTMLARLPVTSKMNFADKLFTETANVSLMHMSEADHTSGSTGMPFHFYQDRHSSLRSCAITERIFRTTGKRYPIVYMRARSRIGFTFYKHVWFFLRSVSSLSYRMKDFYALAQRLPRGFILYGYSSWVSELAREVESLGYTLPIRAVVAAGEHLSDEERVYIEKVLGAPVSMLYASRELGFLGFECEHRRMHVSEEWAYLEIVDANGCALPLGQEGRIVVTTFDNKVMSFIRYDIGDIGVLSEVPCPCKRTLRTLTFKGRISERIVVEDNRAVSILDIAYSLGAYRDAIRRYQIVHAAKMEFVIRVVPGPLFEDKKEFLHAMMVRLLHPRAQVRWELTDAIEEAQSGKAVYFKRDFEYL